MDFRSMQKIFMKIATFLVALSIVVIIALLFFRHQTLTVDTSKPVAIPRDMKKEPVTEERDKANADPYPPVSEQK